MRKAPPQAALPVRISKLHLTAGSAAADPYQLDLTPEQAGWTYTGLRVLALPAGGTHRYATGEDEVVVLPLEGGATVEVDGERYELAGRSSVFAGPTDLVYAPIGSEVSVSSAAGGRFALCTARASRRFPARYLPAAEVPVELRGAGSMSRQVHNFATPQALDADRIIACEVITPGGNWSSYPPHKHDEERPGESALEEIYYFEVRGAHGMAYQRVYGSVDVLAEVRSGDVVLIPHGWHGPSMAVPGYDLYYLNVMAGPGAERAWLICDDPAHSWVRETWPGIPVDPRLPIREEP
jgi:5-deoxy-glucuronate isomerase